MAYKKLTNKTDNERRAIFTQEGYVTIEPGESRVVNVSDDDLKANKDYFDASDANQKDANVEEAPETTFNPPEELPKGDAFDAMSDDALREMIEEKTGEKPHPRTGRAKLLEQAREA